tara:strand:- start:323 stop:466 length:144 start_codon:yes stop_codon:yes gene_type:complete
METDEIIERLNEAQVEESWEKVDELVQELEAEVGFVDPFEDYDEEEF